MGVQVFGGGGGSVAGANARMVAHDDTLGSGASWHWQLDGDGVDAITGGSPVDLTGTLVHHNSGPGTGAVEFLDSKRSTLVQTGAIGAAIRITGAITVAAWICRTADQTANTCIIGARDTGAASANNIQWELGIDHASDSIRALWQHSSGTSVASVAASAITLDTWEHWCMVRNAAGTAVTIYKNGVIVGTQFTGLTAADGGSSVTDICVGQNDGGGDEFQGNIFSAIVFEEEMNAAAVLALYNSTSSTGTW